MTDSYLSRDKAHLAALQRARRQRLVRIDYAPHKHALAVFQARQARERPGSVAATNSAILDAILIEWATLTGIKYSEVSKPKTPAQGPELVDQSARPRMTSAVENKPEQRPAPWTTCGARRHRDGQPCRAKPEPGKARCRFHGGRSTGPRSPEGKARALANLRQYRGQVKSPAD